MDPEVVSAGGAPMKFVTTRLSLLLVAMLAISVNIEKKAAKQGKPTTVTGTMAFDRKEFGMDSGIPFIRIANRVEVTIGFKATRVSGPPLLFER
jgi:hypothetical protein